MRIPTLFSGVAGMALLAGSAVAQQDQTQTTGDAQSGDEAQVAEQCHEDLRSFGQRIQEEGYWLTGVRDRWGADGWAGAPAGPGYYPGVGVPRGTVGAATTQGTAAEDAVDDTALPQAWGLGIRSPGVQIETLFRSAQVLSLRGDQEGCEAVLSELTQLYDEYVGSLQEAGVNPDEVTDWRLGMIAAAQPVGELAADRVSVDEITGTEVRNMQDEYLGDIDDVIISEGEVQQAVISRGGFLGLGENYVAVPWERFQATPDMSLFLLDVPEEALEQAPEVSGDVRRLDEAQRAEVNEFWQQGSD